MNPTIFFPKEARLVLPKNSKSGTQKSKLRFLLLESSIYKFVHRSEISLLLRNGGKTPGVLRSEYLSQKLFQSLYFCCLK